MPFTTPYFAFLSIESEGSSGWQETTLKTGLVCAAFAGRVAFIRPIAALTKNRVGSALLATANAASFGSLYSYASLEWVKDIKSLLSSRSGRLSLQEAALLGVSVIGGILAQGPVFAQAYVFNDGRWLYVGLTSFDSILSIYSLQMSLEYLANQCRGGEIEKKIGALKKEILQRLNAYQTNFNSFSKSDIVALECRIEQVAKWENLKRDLNPEEFVAELLNTILAHDVETCELLTTCTKISNYMLFCFGHILTLTLLSGGGYFAYDAVKTISSNEFLAILSAVGVSLINLYLNGQILSRSTKQIGHEIKAFFLCQSRHSLEKYLRPKMTLAFKGSAIGLGVTASIGGGMIWGHQFPDPERYVMTVLATLTFVAYTLLPMQVIAQRVTRQTILCFGNGEEKDLIKSSCMLASLHRKITHIREKDLDRFLRIHKKSAFESLLERHGLLEET